MVFIGVFFSLSDSKLMPYILPAMPALALLIAVLPPGTLEAGFSASRRRLTAIAGAALALCRAFIGRALIASSDRSAYFLPLAKPVRRDRGCC